MVSKCFAWFRLSRSVKLTPRGSQADKLRTQQELERLQSKYIGTGHPDTTSWEWKTNVFRDTYASIVGHPPQIAYLALAQNEPLGKVHAQMIRVSQELALPPRPLTAKMHVLRVMMAHFANSEIRSRKWYNHADPHLSERASRRRPSSR